MATHSDIKIDVPSDNYKKTILSNRSIRRELLAADRRLRSEHPWLNRQDLIGGTILLAVVLGLAASATAYLTDAIPAAVAVMLVAFLMSIAHELEHDLIHDIYFARKNKLHNLSLNIIWLIKLHANPHWRRDLHLRHHGYSGQAEDWEERLLGLGQPFGWRRILALVSPFGSAIFFTTVAKLDLEFRQRRARVANLPAAIVFHALFYAEILNLALPANLHGLVPSVLWITVSALTVLWVLPSIVRHFCLTLMTTMVHYSDDIPRNNVHFENQIIDHWAFLPIQLFCFNFGATHIVHHYIVHQPFYLRHVVAKTIRKKMIDEGCRHNDVGILFRANRWSESGSWTKGIP